MSASPRLPRNAAYKLGVAIAIDHGQHAFVQRGRAHHVALALRDGGQLLAWRSTSNSRSPRVRARRRIDS
jgi:hypothetical protein